MRIQQPARPKPRLQEQTHKVERFPAEISQQEGFTFTELLVVIGCLAILAVAVLPALAAGKANTQLVACLNNLNRLGTAVHLYAADDNDEMVYPDWGTINRWSGWLYQADGSGSLLAVNRSLGTYNGQPVCPPASPANSNVQKIYQRGALYPYIQQVSPYWCPSQDAAFSQSPWYQHVFLSSPGSTSVGGYDIYSTYIMNGAVISFPSVTIQNSADLKQCKLSNFILSPTISSCGSRTIRVISPTTTPRTQALQAMAGRQAKGM